MLQKREKGREQSERLGKYWSRKRGRLMEMRGQRKEGKRRSIGQGMCERKFTQVGR